MANRYVRTTGGSDANGGTSVADGWATVQFAVDNISTGDTLYLCVMGGGETFTPSAAIDVDAFSTVNSAATTLVGANSSGTIDGTVAEIDATSTSAGTDAITLKPNSPSANDGNMIFRNIRITNAKRDAWRIGEYNAGGGILNLVGDFVFINCHANDAGSRGFYGVTEDTGFNIPWNCYFIGCSATGCGSDGFKSEGIGIHYYACWADNNTGHGFVSNGNEASSFGFSGGDNQNVANATYSHCIASNNNIGFQYFRCLINCTMYNNTDGCQTPRAYSANTRGQNGIFPIINCIFEANTTAVDNNDNADSQPVAMIKNAFYNNTSKYASTSKVAVEIDTVDLSASPFANAGSDDFSLNKTAGAGLACHSTGYPQTELLDGINKINKDLGAIATKKNKIVISA